MPNERRRWRKDSIFGDGPRVPLDRERRARFRFLLRAHRSSNRLTAADLDVGEVLLSALGDDGRLDLAHETIAARALCHVATVKRALKRMCDLGLVDWTRRLVRDARTGWRTEQTTNAYVLRLPSCEAHFARAVRFLRFKKEGRQTEQPTLPGLQPITQALEAAQGALARRRAIIEARLREAAA